MNVRELIEKLMLVENKELNVSILVNYGRGCWERCDDVDGDMMEDDSGDVVGFLLSGEGCCSDSDE